MDGRSTSLLIIASHHAFLATSSSLNHGGLVRLIEDILNDFGLSG
jgi:hypothetical protein